MRTVRSIYQTYIDVIGFTKTDAKRFQNEEIQEDRRQQEDVEMGDEEQIREDEEVGLNDQGFNDK
jgi:hypothetical protein